MGTWDHLIIITLTHFLHTSILITITHTFTRTIT